MGGYSLWLRSKTADKKLESLIRTLCAQHRETPFTPHVTLAGEFKGELEQLKEKAQQLADQFHTELYIPIDSVQNGLSRYQCIYLVCCQVSQLMELGNASRLSYGVGQGQEYFPHLSLLYSKTMPPSTREEIVKEMLDSPEIALIKKNGIVMSTIELWDTHSDNEGEWSCVSAFPLRPRE